MNNVTLVRRDQERVEEGREARWLALEHQIWTWLGPRCPGATGAKDADRLNGMDFIISSLMALCG